MKIALFGGSFNPVHNGHIKMVETIHKIGYDKILVIPTFHSPFKKLPKDSTNQDRLNMLNLAFEGIDYAEVETCEIEREGVSYTFDTVKYLEQKYNSKGMLDGKFGLLIGSDLIKDFDKWKNPDELAKMVDLILVTRPNGDFFANAAFFVNGDFFANADSFANGDFFANADSFSNGDFLYPHKKIQNELCDISSSQIRKNVATKKSISDFVPKNVEKYILEKGLYSECL